MPDWDGFPPERAALILCAVFYVGIWVQLSLMHWSGGFKKTAMWAPVLATPLFAAAAAVGSVDRGGTLGWAMAVVLAAGVLEGLVGVGFHVRGIVGQVGGWTLRNVLSGPPPVLPLAYALIGTLGIGALVWNA